MKKLLYTITIFATLTTCNKDAAPKPDNPYGLPNATQTGANIFACRIDNLNSVAQLNGSRYGGGGLSNYNVQVLGVCPYGNFPKTISLGISIHAKLNEPYNLSDTLETYCLFGTDSTCYYQGSSAIVFKSHDGNITLTKLDTVNKIISGLFAFDVPIPGCDTLHITYGRFDYGY